jgi:hypothetical protein
VNKKSKCYFLVNNDYHVEFIKGFIYSLPNFKILIKTPVKLSNSVNEEIFNKIEQINFNELNSLFYLIFKPFFIYRKIKEIQNKFTPDENDILFLNTDMFILNHLIVYKFIQSKCKIYLLEDGAATMTYFNIISTHPGPLIKFKELIYNFIYNFKKTSYRKFDQEIMPILDDKIFTALIVNIGNSTNRKIDLFKIKIDDLNKINTSNDSAIFFNQPLYMWYCDFESYFNFVEEIIKVYSSLCDILYIKFHPGDSILFKNKLSNYICQFKNVKIINRSLNAENLIYEIPVKHTITINSTSVLNLLKLDCNPIFLNYIFNLKFPSKTGDAFNLLLKNINCDYPTDLKSVTSLSTIYYNYENSNFLNINQIIND